MIRPNTGRDSNRREFLKHVGLGLASTMVPAALGRSAFAAAPGVRPKIAAIVTEFTFRSHGHVILENFLNPYLFNGKMTDPGVDIVSLYVDQTPRRDLSREASRRYKVPIFPTIGEAVRVGGKDLAVDGVLAIGEHGRYPVNAKGQREYPRKRFFDEIVAVFEASGRSVPVFNDKHLSYRWDWAKEMYDTARRLNFPFMAGSSVPLAQRRPPLELPANAEIRSAVAIHGGNVESYDFHGLEVLQSMVEARRGGETGVKEVRFLTDDALWKAADEGLWSTELADAAMAADLGPGLPPLRELIAQKFPTTKSHGILITYADGLRAIVLKVGNSATRWNFACKVEGESTPAATAFYVGPWQNRNLFKAFSHAIRSMFLSGTVPFPVERTLLTTGVLDAAMDSRFRKGEVTETPQLAIAYQPVDYRSMREMGDSWKIITDQVVEPKGLEPLVIPAR